MLLGAAVAAPNAALAQFGPSPGPPPALAGPPPGLGAGGPPPGLGAGGPPLVGRIWRWPSAPCGRGSTSASANSYTRNGYASNGHGYRYWPYAAAVAYAYGRSYASSDDGCGAFWCVMVMETD